MPTARDTVRRELLISGLRDWVSLSEVDSVIVGHHLVDSIPAKQELAQRAIRSLLEGGLMVIGDLTGDGGRFRAWGLGLEAAMERLHDRYVTHYSDRHEWVFSVWLDLTDTGEQVARQLQVTAPTE